MAKRGPHSVAKRRRELAKKEKRDAKRERRAQKAEEKAQEDGFVTDIGAATDPETEQTD
jgi:hypothetical protein